MKATDEQVEELARWLHGTFREAVLGSNPWESLPEYGRRYYRHVARALLERPPPALLDALGGCAPDAVAGRAAP